MHTWDNPNEADFSLLRAYLREMFWKVGSNVQNLIAMKRWYEKWRDELLCTRPCSMARSTNMSFAFRFCKIPYA